MIDIGMLEELARPVGMWMGTRRLPGLEEVFARIAAADWSPRQPAFEPELVHLETSAVRGDCTAPLLQHDDIVYLDPRMPALTGDLVSFALSARGAEIQNSALPPGQSPWERGAHWIKLLVNYRGYPMLLDRHGNSATVSLMGGESPDDDVPLSVVRNVRRAGQLLFTPAYSAQIGPDAVSQMLNGVVTTPYVPAGPYTGNPVSAYIAYLQITTSGLFPVAVDVYFTFTLEFAAGTTAWNVTFDIYNSNTSTRVGAPWTLNNTKMSWTTVTNYSFNTTLIGVDAAPAGGVNTYQLRLTATATAPAPGSWSINVSDIKLREIKK